MRRLKIGIQSVDQPVISLSGGQRQAVAVARAIAWGTRIVIMDEPTAALGVRESAMVLELIKEVKNQGVAIVMISHNLPEVFMVADRITVLRLGRTITTLRRRRTPRLEAVVGMMTGAVSVGGMSGVEPVRGCADVATEAGVSVKTVSRVVNRRSRRRRRRRPRACRPRSGGSASAATRWRGRYAPAGSRFGCSASSSRTSANPFYSAIARGVEEVMRGAASS